MNLADKMIGTGRRVLHAISWMPKRLVRLGRHLQNGCLGRWTKPVSLPMHPFALWWVELIFYSLDVLAIPEWYEIWMDWFKWNTRPLTGEEKKLARSIFGDSIDYQRVRIDESAKIVCQKHQVFYVSFFTINGWGKLHPAVFLHEMMHIWQYQQLGSVYIPQALLAQRTAAGYDYGGVENLMAVIAQGGSLADFNLEQQADIVSDFYCLQAGLMPRWCEPYKIGAREAMHYFVRKLSAK